MPYITNANRRLYDRSLNDLHLALEQAEYNEGHVTYVLYMIVARWFTKIPAYKTIARIRGVLHGTTAEFDRQFAAPYEDEKIKENGDVNLKPVQQGKISYYLCPCCAHEVEVKG